MQPSEQYPPPLMKWRSRDDRERTKNHLLVKRRYQDLVNDIWGRLPPSARVGILGHPCQLNEILLANPHPGRGDRLEDCRAIQRTGEVILNVAGYCDIRIKVKRVTMAWTLAHELAHAYLSAVSEYAKIGVSQRFWKQSGDTPGGQPPPLLTPEHWNLLGAVNLSDGIPCVSAMDKEETTYSALTGERMADAVAIAWGFGLEYATMLYNEGLDLEFSSDLGADPDNYLAPDIILMHEILGRRDLAPS